MTYQQLSVGKHRAGTVVDVHLNGELLHIWAGSQLIKTVVRTERKEVDLLVAASEAGVWLRDAAFARQLSAARMLRSLR